MIPTEAPAPATTPAEQAKQDPAPAQPSLDAIKQERYAQANEQLQAQAKAVADAAAAEAMAAKQAEAAKAAEADQVKQLTTKLTEAQTQATTLAERAKLAEKLEAASTLAKSGKHYDAIKLLQEATGADLDLAVQELINPGSTPKPEPDKAKAEDEPEAVKALREQVEKLTKLVADKEANEAAMVKEQGRRSIVAHVEKEKAQFPFLASNEAWVNEALGQAEKDYADAVKANQDQDLSQDQKNDLIEKALKSAEAKRKDEALNYAKILGLQVKNPTVVVDTKPVSKPTLTYTGTGPGQTPALPQGKVKSLEELKRARRAAN